MIRSIGATFDFARPTRRLSSLKLIDATGISPSVVATVSRIRPFFQPILRSDNATMTTNLVATKIRASLPAEGP